MGKVANQKTVIIKKSPCIKDFLQIQNDEWQEAARLCNTFSAFKIYMYLASNAANYQQLLSEVAASKALGFQKTAYYNGIKELKDLGYLVDIGNGCYEFYTKSKNSAVKEDSALEENKEFSALKESSAVEENKENKENKINSALEENSAVKEKKVIPFEF